MALDFLRLRSESFGSQPIDTKAVSDFVAGDLSLKDALGLDDEVVQRMRAQARALHAIGKWDRVVDIIIGVVELGGAQVEDLVLVTEAYAELGDEDAYQRCSLVLEGLLYRLEQNLPPAGTHS